MGKKLLNAKQIFTYSKINIRFVQSWKHLVHLPETQNFYLEVKDFFLRLARSHVSCYKWN